MSGLTAAYYLKKLGYRDVTVFERMGDVGGKVLSYKYEGNIYDLGAIIIGDEKNYRNYHELLAAYEIPFEHFSTPHVAFLDGYRCTFERYLKDYYSFASIFKAFFYMLYVGIKFRKYLKSGFIEASPDLYINFKDFIQTHRIEPIADTLSPFLIGCGYGCYEEIPALYLFRFLWLIFRNSVRIKTLINVWSEKASTGIRGCQNGCQELWTKMAEDLHVETNSEIEAIQRKETELVNTKEAKIAVVVNGQTREYDRLIISSLLEEADQFLDLSAEENDLFSKIIHTDYYVTLFKGDGFDKSLFIRDHIHPETKGRTVAIFCRHCDSKVYMGYQMALPDMNRGELIEILKQDVEKLGGRFLEVITQKHWRYFPRVDVEDLGRGFYRRLDELQGQKGTYYIGAVMNFETLENSVDFAKKTVLKHFN